MRSCSRVGSNHLCGRHGSPDRKVGEVHCAEGCPLEHFDDGHDDTLRIEGLGGTVLVPAASVAYIREPIANDL